MKINEKKSQVAKETKKTDVRLVNEQLDLEVCGIVYPLKKVTKEDDSKIGLNYEIGDKVNFKLLVNGFTRKLEKLVVLDSFEFWFNNDHCASCRRERSKKMLADAKKTLRDAKSFYSRCSEHEKDNAEKILRDTERGCEGMEFCYLTSLLCDEKNLTTLESNYRIVKNNPLYT
ncbi:3310_t:CDS:2, partial [Scutellospora calospora]